MGCYFDKCIIIGTGQFAFNCAKYLYDMYRLDNVYEYGNCPQSRMEMLCEKNNLLYARLANKAECDKLMQDIVQSGEKTIIVSASNTYIFPKFITDNANIKIVNYHPGLLTKHLGRNAESWAIYEQDKIVGVTWHEVTSEIDHGLILAEKTIEVDSTISAIKLMIKQYQMGFELFKEFIKQLLENKEIQGKTVVYYGKMHYSYEKPNDGILDLTWNQDKISAFLRSMDYGGLNVMGRPLVIENGSKYCWDSYKILDSISGGVSNSDKIINQESVYIILQNYHKLDTL